VLAALIAATVLLGFAKTYFLAGLFAAKLPSLLVHVHGVLFTSWIALLTAQIILIALGRVRLHMRLGIVGMFLAPLMVIVGFATLFAAIRRPTGENRETLSFRGRLASSRIGQFFCI
jgi:hypothetical protein